MLRINFFLLLVFLFNGLVYADVLSPQEEKKLNTLCVSIARSDPAIIAVKSKEELDDARVSLVREALEYPQLRSSCFPLLRKDIISSLDLSEKLHLLVLGQLSWIIYFLIVFCVFMPFFIYFGLHYFLGSVEAGEANEGKRSKKYSSRQRDMQTGVDEYTSLLDYFNLDDTATEADIKRAYRELAKAHHPDTADAKSREEFDLVQTNYDKLMKLRKGWFGLAR